MVYYTYSCLVAYPAENPLFRGIYQAGIELSPAVCNGVGNSIGTEDTMSENIKETLEILNLNKDIKERQQLIQNYIACSVLDRHKAIEKIKNFKQQILILLLQQLQLRRCVVQ